MRPPRSILRPDSESTQNSVQNMNPPYIEVPSKESLVWSNHHQKMDLSSAFSLQKDCLFQSCKLDQNSKLDHHELSKS